MKALWTLLFLISVHFLFAQKKQKETPPPSLRLEWQLLANRYQGGERNLAVFTLSAAGKQAFPASGWSLYFNYNRGAEVVAGAPAEIQHINGDLYRLRPTASFPALSAGTTAAVRFLSDGEVRNYSSAPMGVYLVWDKNPEQGIPVKDYRLLPMPDTSVERVSPADVYERNRSIQDIPEEQLVKIFPTPITYREGPPAFLLNSQVSIASDPIFLREAQFLREALDKKLGIGLPEPGGPGITIRKTEAYAEYYYLKITENRIEIGASDAAGAFYAVQSLLSLLRPENQTSVGIMLPELEVIDGPRFGLRSLSLDVARHFRTKEEVLKVLDLMAMYKLNTLHFHCIEDEGWRLEIPSLPELTEIGAKRGHSAKEGVMLQPSYGSGPIVEEGAGSGYYSRADFIEILRYATERHIEVVTEIESPGHSRAAIKAMDARYERLLRTGTRAEAEQYLLRDMNDLSVYSSAQLWTDNVMCVALPSVYTFMEKVIDEITAMYRDAGAPLRTIHLGGDEVPAGAWEKSPLCQKLIAEDPALENTDDLWYYYYGKLNDILHKKGLFMSGWEEMAMRKTRRDGQPVFIPNPEFTGKKIRVHVWNNVVGWGAEDLPYRLANAGYDVVLSPVSNNYFDMCYFRHPDEPGFYWGGYQDIDKPFYFIPYNYYKNTREGPNGNPVDPSAVFIGKDALTDYGKSHIVGLEGLVWSETLQSFEATEYLLLPKLLGFAERAWSPDPLWATEKDPKRAAEMYDFAWSEFVNIVGKRELSRLHANGYHYRIPTPGILRKNGLVYMNVQFPGLTIRYTTDGSEPNATSPAYTKPFPDAARVRARVYDAAGRGSRVVEW